MGFVGSASLKSWPPDRMECPQATRFLWHSPATTRARVHCCAPHRSRLRKDIDVVALPTMASLPHISEQTAGPPFCTSTLR